MSIMRGAEEHAAWLERSRNTWNERAPGWDEQLEARPRDRQVELERAVNALALRPGQRVLDAGCGTGQWAVGFARFGCTVTAIDLAPAMLERARARAAEAGVAITFREGDLGALEEPDGSVEAVHCRCVLQFSPDPAGVLREFARVLAPGGRLYAAVPGALSPIYAESYRRLLEPLSNNRILPWELERVLETLGWTILDGWGRFSIPDQPEIVPADVVDSLPRSLRQAAAFYWVTVARTSPQPLS
jgi:SAM-dependent methyltransferase